MGGSLKKKNQKKKNKKREFPGSTEEWHHVGDGRRESEARPSLLHSLSLGVQKIQPRPSIQPIIKFMRRLLVLVFPISKQNKKNGIFTSEIGKSGYL